MSLTVCQARQMFNRTVVQTHVYLSERIYVCSVITLIAHSLGYVSVHPSDCRPVWPDDWPVPPAISPFRLTGWPDRQAINIMNGWLIEQMPGYAHDMNWNAHIENRKIFFFRHCVSLTNDRQTSRRNQIAGGNRKSWISDTCNQTGPKVTAIPADWTDGKTADWTYCWMCVCRTGKSVKTTITESVEQPFVSTYKRLVKL